MPMKHYQSCKFTKVPTKIRKPIALEVMAFKTRLIQYAVL